MVSHRDTEDTERQEVRSQKSEGDFLASGL